VQSFLIAKIVQVGEHTKYLSSPAAGHYNENIC